MAGKHSVDYAELNDRINGAGFLGAVFFADDLISTANSLSREYAALVAALPELKAQAVEAARDAIMPPVNWNLRPDGTEIPGTQHVDGALHDIHVQLTQMAADIRSGEAGA